MQKRISAFIFICMAMLCTAIPAAAQENTETAAKPMTLETCQAALISYKSDFLKTYDALQIEKKKSTESYNQVNYTYNELLASGYRRDMAFHDIQVEAFKEQATHGVFSLVVMSILMAAGLIFAGIQLWFGVKYGVKVESSENAIEMGNLSFKSSVMGITVLFIWLIAYFIYVDKIYPIEVVEVMSEIKNTGGAAATQSGQ